MERNTVTYTVHVRAIDGVGSIDDVLPPPTLSDLRMDIAKLTEGHLWTNEGCDLQPSTASDQKKTTTTRVYHGATYFGDCIDDEWLIVYVMMELSKKYHSHIFIQMVDDDGDFLLIEAAEALPEWLTPYNSANRVFLFQGQLHIIPQQINVSPVRPQDIVLECLLHDIVTVASAEIQQVLRHKLAAFPQYIQDNLHHVRVFLPSSAAYMVYQHPPSVARSVQHFYAHEPRHASAWLSKMTNFSPIDRVEVRVALTKCMYAQLQQQTFSPPKPFQEHFVGVDQNPRNTRAAELGMKITCGLELYRHIASQEQISRDAFTDLASANVLEREEFQEFVLAQQHRCAQEPEDDDDSWMFLEPETLEQILTQAQAKLSEPETTTMVVDDSPGGSKELDDITAMMNKFMFNSTSSYEGVEDMDDDDDDDQESWEKYSSCSSLDSSSEDEDDAQKINIPMDLNVDRLLEILQGHLGPQNDDDLRKGDADQAEKQSSAPDLSSLMDEMDAEMDAHLAENTHESISRSDDPVDVDFNLVSNLLESVIYQAGQAGPVTSMLKEMGIGQQ